MRRLLLCVGWMLLAGCGDESDVTPGDDPGPEAPAETPDHVGAWYGEGPEFPEGAICVLLCENGRAFIGDRPCTETTAGDFQTYLTYTRSGDAIELRRTSGVVTVFTLRALTGDTATFVVEGRDLPMSRTARTSPLCTDASRTPR